MKKLEEFDSFTLSVVYRKISRFKYSFVKACERIFLDWEEIKTVFSIKDGFTISSIQGMGGDEHGLGDKTVVIAFNEGQTGFAYKPINVTVDQIVNRLFSLHENNYIESYDQKFLRFITRNQNSNSYGYIEYCPYNGVVENMSSAAIIYEDFGRLLAFGKLLKIADGHSDNLIVNFPRVIWLDLETAFHSYSQDVKVTNELEKTGLLCEFNPQIAFLGVVTGIQGGVIPKLRLTRPTAYSEGSNEMYLRYFHLINHAKKIKNRVYIGDILCLPENYAHKIKFGYRYHLSKIIENKNKILDFLETHLNKAPIQTRHLFLITACYARYEALLNHTIGRKNGNILALIRSEREQAILPEEQVFKNFIIENEIVDLSNGVIPYFFRKSNSSAIYHASGVSRPGFFKKTLMEEMSEHLNTLSLESLNEDCEFIDRALNSTANIESWEDFSIKFNIPAII